jgi:hypothetical protein
MAGAATACGPGSGGCERRKTRKLCRGGKSPKGKREPYSNKRIIIQSDATLHWGQYDID